MHKLYAVSDYVLSADVSVIYRSGCVSTLLYICHLWREVPGA